MTKTLPRQIDPIRLCDLGAKLEGEMPLQSMNRLVPVLAEKNGKVEIFLLFNKEKQGFRSICGKIVAQLMLTCQRCLQPMPYEVNLKVSLSPVFNEGQAANLPKDFEALIVKEQPTILAEMIEEELLLNLPIIVKHEVNQCPVKLTDLDNASKN